MVLLPSVRVDRRGLAGAAVLLVHLAVVHLAAGAEAADEVKTSRTDPDPVYFEDRIQPLLLNRCAFAGCHGGAGAGRLILERADFTGRMTLDRTANNLATTLTFVKFGAPMESRLVLKPLIKRQGGLPHSGDEYDFRETSEEFDLLSQWIRGVELEDVLPIADAGADQQAKVGQELTLDGSASRERRGRSIEYAWRVLSMPDGAAPLLKGADTVTPSFRADKDGAYTLALVVDNGALKSEASSVTISVDSLPFQTLPAEGATSLDGLHITKDPAAAGGSAIRVSQGLGEGGVATATFAVTLPEGGPYRLYARVRPSEFATDPPAEVNRGTSSPRSAPQAAPPSLRFRFDEGPEQELIAPSSPGYRLLPVLGPDVRPILKEASGEVVAGSAELKAGRLWLRGTVDRPGVFFFDAPASAGSSASTSLRIELPRPGTASDAMTMVLFGGEDPRNAYCAGVHFGRQRLMIGAFENGELTVLAERRFGVRPDMDVPITVDLRADRVFLFSGEEPFLEAGLHGPIAAGRMGVLSTVVGSFDAIEVAMNGKAVLANEFSVDAQPEGYLSAGRHVLTVTADSILAPPLDEVFLARADFSTSVSDEDRRAVRGMYLDLVGRVPTPIELMMAAGHDQEALADRLLGSLEFYENLYELELYYFLLLDNFRPKTPQMDSIPARLMNRQLSVKDAFQEIVISQYFNARNPGNDTFVSVVFEQLLGITVQDEPKLLDAGKAMYDGAKATIFGKQGDRQSDIVSIVMAEEGLATQLLGRHYERVIGRPASKGDLERWSAAFRVDPFAYEDIVREWVTSPEYAAAGATLRKKTDHMWIRSLFVDLLERKPSFAEYRNFRNAVQALSDSSPVRAVLSKVIVDSGQAVAPEFSAKEPRDFVVACFRRYLGRAPSPAESAAFTEALSQPDGRPELLIAAILTSAEYQHY